MTGRKKNQIFGKYGGKGSWSIWEHVLFVFSFLINRSNQLSVLEYRTGYVNNYILSGVY